MKSAILFAAVSSRQQAQDDKVSLERQIELGREHAEKWKLSIYGQLIIPGVSRSITLYDRAANTVQGIWIDQNGDKEETFVYAKLLEMIEAKAFDVLIFLNRSRLGRKASLSETVIELCNEHGIKPYDMESPPSTLDVGNNYAERLVGAFRSHSAQQEIVNLVASSEAGKRKRAENGYMPGRITFGYVPIYDSKRNVSYTVDEYSVETILMIHGLYMENGLGTNRVSNKLNELGRKAPAGQRWHHKTVRQILKNSLRYAGFVEYNKISKKGSAFIKAPALWPSIITEDRANAILLEIDRRLNKQKSIGSTRLFSMILKCSICGATLHASPRIIPWSLADGTTVKYSTVRYACRQHGGMSEKKIKHFFNNLFSELQDESAQRRLAGNDTTMLRDKTLAVIDVHRSSIATIADRLRRLEDLLLDGDISIERYRQRKKEFDDQTKRIYAEIDILEKSLTDLGDYSERIMRAKTLAQKGADVMTMSDHRKANAWLRQYLCVYISPGSFGSVQMI